MRNDKPFFLNKEPDYVREMERVYEEDKPLTKGQKFFLAACCCLLVLGFIYEILFGVIK